MRARYKMFPATSAATAGGTPLSCRPVHSAPSQQRDTLTS